MDSLPLPMFLEIVQYLNPSELFLNFAPTNKTIYSIVFSDTNLGMYLQEYIGFDK